MIRSEGACVIKPSARLLRLLSTLASRPSWTNRELAAELQVTERTVRRDIAGLRDLGYSIQSDPDPWGGYRLGGGTSLPPLPLDDDEALAVVVALQEAALSGLLGHDRAAFTALAKLQRLLPPRMAARLEGFLGIVVHTPRVAEEPVTPAVLLTLATACRAREALRITYRDRRENLTSREVAPWQLVRTRNRWYLVALDNSKHEWRTFRADRVIEAQLTGRLANLVEPPDAARMVSEMLLAEYPFYATVQAEIDFGRAQRLVPPGAGSLEPDGAERTLITFGGHSLEEIAVRVLQLGTRVRIIEPVELKGALHAWMGTVIADGPES
ncbi:helix-turn-helix transcriptional regulator [Amycolatopsis sacchari]|uniref:helix-turn-helix transcriptional regulator n=1 Tax=Amycolatopsis sacchari TaxID=115433 RepID=UPI003D70A7FF